MGVAGVGRPNTKKNRLEKFTSRPFLCMPSYYYQLKAIEKITQHMI